VKAITSNATEGFAKEDLTFRLGAIISDYDGTLAMDEVPKEKSAIPKQTERELRALAGEIPFAIITSKDFSFIYPRAKFANAWACVSGLEIVLPDGKSYLEAVTKVSGLKENVRAFVPESCAIEPKKSSTGQLLGLSIDWRYGEKPSPQTIKSIVEEFSKRGTCVSYEESRPFIDIYAGVPNKGRALLKVKELLRIRGPVMYIGDSVMDNAAFVVADLPVCVLHGQSAENLSWKFAVSYDELPLFLRDLRERGFVFTPAGMPALTRRADGC
jgi:hydroxymethylpyrimidine pyrophosphatase-like HAD family hydrolase